MIYPFSARALLLLLVCTFAGIVSAEDSKKADAKKPEKPGNWLQIPADGSPWKHIETGITYPQKLGDFVLQAVFRDKRDEAGIALTYVEPKTNMRADVVLFPSKATQVTPDNVLKIVRTEHEHLVSDLVAVAAKRGYAERDRSDIDENGIEIFRKGKLPMTAQTIDFVSANGDATGRPPLNEWVGLTLYADYFIQMHLLLPAKKDSKPEDAEKLAKQADQIIMLLLQCVKHPAVVPKLLELCTTYLDHPIDDIGRDAADALLSFSSTPMFNIPLPGEVITPALDEIGERSKDSALDLLRAFVVGSSVVALQHGTVDQSLAEGCRMIGMVRDLLQKQNVNMDSKLLDDLLAAQKEGKAAEFIRARLPKPTK